MIIIGITGPAGSGKGTVVDYLIKKGFIHFSARAFITEHIIKQNLPINRDSMVVVANELRRIHGPSYCIESLYEKAVKHNKNSVIESIRTIGEIDALKKQEKKNSFILLAINAEQRVRYERIKARGSETDNITFETFKEHEIREMENSDPSKQNISACIKQANEIIVNQGTITELHQKIDSILQKYI